MLSLYEKILVNQVHSMIEILQVTCRVTKIGVGGVIRG